MRPPISPVIARHTAHSERINPFPTVGAIHESPAHRTSIHPRRGGYSARQSLPPLRRGRRPRRPAMPHPKGISRGEAFFPTIVNKITPGRRSFRGYILGINLRSLPHSQEALRVFSRDRSSRRTGCAAADILHHPDLQHRFHPHQHIRRPGSTGWGTY